MSREAADLAREARELILGMVSKARAAHVGSSLSVVDLLAVIYSELRIHPEDWAAWSGEDVLILSKGHAAASLYAILALKGFFPREWIDDYGNDGAALGGHVTFGVPGVELSTGSLGHGLPFGLGIALHRRRIARGGRIVVVMSDGELDEGTTWESLLIGSHHGLSNLAILIDRNNLQSLESTEATLGLEPLEAKFRSFGWDTQVIDGHDFAQVSVALQSIGTTNKPLAVICDTTKGKGVSFMENEVRWHYRPPSPEELKLALEEVLRA